MKNIHAVLLLYYIFLIGFCLNNTNDKYLKSPQVNCGFVQDGITQGRFDVQFQRSTNTIGANWGGFGNDVLFYEWSIISEERLPKSIRDSDNLCIKNLKILPDIQSWESIKKATSAFNSGLNLVEGYKYRVMVRATYRSGYQNIAISNGVLVIPSNNEEKNSEINNNNNNNNNDNENDNNDKIFAKNSKFPHIRSNKKPKNFEINSNSRLILDEFKSQMSSIRNIFNAQNNNINNNNNNNDNNNNENKKRFIRDIPEKTIDVVRNLEVREHVEVADLSLCPIDAENRCRASKIRVYDRLTDIYGPPIFDDEILPRDDDDGDDDDGDDDDSSIGGGGGANVPEWVIAPFAIIFIPLLLLCCLLLILGVLFLKIGGFDDDDDNSVAYEFEESNEESKGYGNRPSFSLDDTETGTRIEFPDTQIRRLSITHEDEPDIPDSLKDTRSPRRKNPMNQTTSSSFRDYRSVSNNK